MLPIKDLNGDTHLVTNIKQIVRHKKVNGEKTIQFVSIPDKHDADGFDAINNESTFIFQNEPYIIKNINEKSVGDVSIKQVDTVHTFFNDMINCQQYNLHTGSQTFFAALTRVFENTPYSFSIVDSFTAKTFENFGRDNCLSLFKNVLERYGAEFEVIGTTVYLRTEIGAKTDFQLRWKSNIKGINKQVNTDGLATKIRGFGGKPNETTGVYPVDETYISPNLGLFTELLADAVYDERLSTIAGMQEHLQKTLVDEPQLSITVDIAEVNGDVKNEGDRGFIIYEPMRVKLESRCVEITETFECVNGKWVVIKTDVTLANLRNKLSDITTRFAQTAKTVNRLFAGNEVLPYNVLPEAIRLASEAINNSLTEIQYPVGQGIILQDPVNPLIMVRLTSAGIGLSIDGGTTYRTALTGAGIVTNELVAGVIRTNNIQIVGQDDLFFWDGTGLYAYNAGDLTRYVKLNSGGLYIAKGALSMERPDGYVAIDNGVAVADFAIQGCVPPFKSGLVELLGRYHLTQSTTAVDVDFISFKHDARYLKITIGMYSELVGSDSVFSVHPTGGGAVLATFSTNNTDPAANESSFGVVVTVDLGIPTGSSKGLYLRLNTSNASSRARLRIIKKWKEG